jgi:hypothetical protein
LIASIQNHDVIDLETRSTWGVIPGRPRAGPGIQPHRQSSPLDSAFALTVRPE